MYSHFLNGRKNRSVGTSVRLSLLGLLLLSLSMVHLVFVVPTQDEYEPMRNAHARRSPPKVVRIPAAHRVPVVDNFLESLSRSRAGSEGPNERFLPRRDADRDLRTASESHVHGLDQHTGPQGEDSALQTGSLVDLTDTDNTDLFRTTHEPHFAGVTTPEGTSMIQRGMNSTRVSYLLHRIVRHYDVRSVLDPQCAQHVSWMPALVATLLEDVPDFRYICNDDSVSRIRDLRERFKQVPGSIEFVVATVFRSVAVRADLVFLWQSLQHIHDPELALECFRLLARSGSRYAALINNPGMPNESESGEDFGHSVNLRRPPFAMPPPIRVISQLDYVSTIPKQLFLYPVNVLKTKS